MLFRSPSSAYTDEPGSGTLSQTLTEAGQAMIRLSCDGENLEWAMFVSFGYKLIGFGQQICFAGHFN